MTNSTGIRLILNADRIVKYSMTFALLSILLVAIASGDTAATAITTQVSVATIMAHTALAASLLPIMFANSRVRNDNDVIVTRWYVLLVTAFCLIPSAALILAG